MKLSSFDNRSFKRGAIFPVECLWGIVQMILFSTDLPGSGWRCGLLRMFGAKIGKGVVIKPRVRVKFPWRLVVGSHSWIGEAVWIDNLEKVAIGNDVCISQAAFLCTGNHDWTKQSFDLVAKPIVIENSVWLGAKSIVGPGVTVEEGCVIGLGSVVHKQTKKYSVYMGNPAVQTTERVEK